ncbi:RNA-directed RNA polymerase, putative [Entamoeba histolytica HM-3:IMSS]|nr:RNA-directed RNA polymerase, putative [Entamoeba histolytica HM-3:IMSS]BAN39292.1 RNA-directed RNA polymerase, putative [Entamoeba histolytica]GAT97250.1 RNA-directed RNA polymerase putative [Entamoeba histolytica]
MEIPIIITTLVQTIQTLMGPEFTILPFLFVSTGIFYPILVLLSGIISTISLYLYRVIQQNSALYTITDLSQHNGGRTVLSITKTMRIFYNILLLGIILTIVSSSIESLILTMTHSDHSQWWKGNSIIKSLVITLLTPLCYLFSYSKLLTLVSLYSCYLLPFLFFLGFVYSLGSLYINGIAANTNVVDNIWRDIGHHHIFPSYSMLMCIFAPFKQKINEPSESPLAVILSYIIVIFFAIVYGVCVGLSLGPSTTSMPFSSYLIINQSNPSMHSLAVILNILLIIIFLLQTPSYFVTIYEDIESFYFTSWQPSKRRRWILSMFIFSLIGLSSSFFWQCTIQISLNGSISGSYFVHFLPASMALFVSKNKSTKVASVIMIIFGVLFASSGISGSSILFIESVVDNYINKFNSSY